MSGFATANKFRGTRVFDCNPEEHQEILLDLHNKLTSKEWWIFNFIGQDAVWFRDQFDEVFVRLVGEEDCVGNNIKVVREEGKSFILAILMVRKSRITREIFTVALALEFPTMASNISAILNANTEQDLFVFMTSKDSSQYHIEVMRVWQKCLDVDPNNIPPFPFHLSLIE
jgi:hypothetical protein